MSRIPTKTQVEAAAGCKADFIVWYSRGDKRYYDVMWAKSASEAESRFAEFASELGWTVSDVTVETRP